MGATEAIRRACGVIRSALCPFGPTSTLPNEDLHPAPGRRNRRYQELLPSYASTYNILSETGILPVLYTIAPNAQASAFITSFQVLNDHASLQDRTSEGLLSARYHQGLRYSQQVLVQRLLTEREAAVEWGQRGTSQLCFTTSILCGGRHLEHTWPPRLRSSCTESPIGFERKLLPKAGSSS